MDRDGFGALLGEWGFDGEAIGGLMDLAERFETFAGCRERAAAVPGFAKALIDEGVNTPQAFWALVAYGRFVVDDDLAAAVMSFVDGGEALGNLFTRLGDALGTEERDRVFAGIDLPPLGTPATDLPAHTGAVMERVEAEVDPAVLGPILSSCLRDLDDAWFAEAKAFHEEHRDIDALLAWRRERLMETLETCRREGRPWFVQEITDDVIEFVHEHPEISTGERRGDTILEVKIPHMTKEWLEAADDRERRYHYCHCPWAKESILRDDVEVPASFCSCSSGFHKRFWEVVLGRPLEAEILESVLAGDDRCAIAIHLPADLLGDD